MIVSGCFRNYLQVSVADPLLIKSSKMAEWFSIVDQLQGCVK